MPFIGNNDIGLPSILKTGFGAASVDSELVFSSSTPSGTLFKDKGNSGTRRPLQQGRCYHGDGVDDYVLIPDSADFDITTTLSVSCWAKNDKNLLSATESLIGKFDTGLNLREWLIGLTGGETFRVFLGNPSTGALQGEVETSSAITNPDAWHHYAFTFDSGTVKLYVDAIEQATTIASGTIPTTLNNDVAAVTLLTLLNSGAPVNEWDGQAFDFRVYSKTLTASEITHIYTFGVAGTNPTTTNLVAQYKCDEQAGTTSYDSSGNAKNGTITNATLSTFHATQTKYSFQNQVGYSGGLYFDGTGDAAYADSLGYDENTKQSYYVKFLADSNAIGYLWATRDGSNGGLSVFVDNSQNLTFVVGTTTAYIENSQAYDDGLFHELFTYYDGNDQLTVYVDGVEKTTDEPITTTSWNSAQPFILGARGNTLPAVSVDFEGVISEMRVWSGESSPQIPSEMDTSTTTRWYKLDENINDSGSDSRHLKLLGDPGWSFIPRNESNTANDITGAALDFTGKAPQDAALIDSTCADFDGTNDIAISNSVILSTTDGTQPYSFSIWINSTDTLAGIMTQYVVASAKRFGLRINADKINYFKASDLVTSTTSINDGVWHHCVFTKASDGTVNCYVDGAFEATGSDTLAFDNDNFTLGMFVGSTAPNQYDGLMSDARIYDTELTAANVLYLFDSTKGTDPGTASLIAHWPIEEGGGTTIFDVSGNDYHCELQNATLSTFWGTTQDNKHYNITKGFDGSLHFDGVNDLVDFGNVLDKNDTDSFSIEGWMYTTTTDAGVLVAKRNSRETVADAGYSIARASSGAQIVFRISDGVTQVVAASGLVTSPDGTPDHFAAVCNRTTNVIQIYVNGALLDTESVSAVGSITNAVALQFGAANGTSFFGGNLGRIRVYGGALTSDNVTYLYTGGASGTAPTETLDADWKLNDGRGTLVHDYSGNNYIGTFTSAPVWTRVPASASSSSLLSGGQLTNPAGAKHNNAATDIDFDPSSTPEMANLHEGWCEFDGVGDLTDHGDTLDRTTDDFSITGWFRTDSTSTTVVLAKRSSRTTTTHAGYSIDINSSGRQLTFRICNGTSEANVSTGAVIDPNDAWHHFACVCDRANNGMLIYLDGELKDNTPSISIAGFGSLTTATNYQLGAAGSSSPFIGDLKEVRVYDVALDATEIVKQADGNPTTDNLAAYFPLYKDALDHGGNNYHGVIVGNPVFPGYTVPATYGFKDSLGEQRNHFKRVQQIDSAYARFNGSSSVVTLPAKVAEAAAGTLILDFFISNITGSLQTLISLGGTTNDGLILFSDDSGGATLQHGTGAGTNKIAQVVTEGTWYRACVRWSGSDVEFYLNGSSVGSSSSGSFTDIDSTTQVIGNQSAASRYHTGGIANCYIFNVDKGDAFATANGTIHALLTNTDDLKARYNLHKDAKDIANNEHDGTPANITFDGYQSEDKFLIYKTGLVGFKEKSQLNNFVKSN